MVDVGVRDLGNLRLDGRGPEGRPDPAMREPIPPNFPVAPIATPDPGGSATAPVALTPFAQAASRGEALAADALGIDGTLRLIAELIVHRGTGTPLCVGLLGAPGSGKSFALGRLAAQIRDLADAAARGAGGPFLARIHVQAIDAANLEGDPVAALAAKLHAGLRRPYPDFAREAGHAARDPHVVLREVNEKLDDARRRLDSERRALDDAGSRRARLVETVLYEAAGSQVDAYARANRASLENRLGAFGIAGEPIRDFKDLVQVVSGPSGASGLTARAFWAFKGQTKLIAAALALAGLGAGLGIAIDDQARWLDALRTGPQAGASVADWMEAHMGLIASGRTIAFAGAVLALAANVARAAAFLQPIGKGARLLRADLDGRRRDLDGLYAHQTKRVDMLDADVERLTRGSAEAERRAGGPGADEAPSPFQADAGGQAQSFLALLGARMAGEGRARADTPVPQRIVLAIDHLDTLAPDRARAILDALNRSLDAGLVAIVAADPARLVSAGPDEGEREALERWIQVPVRVDAGAGSRDHAPLVQAALGRPASGQASEGRAAARAKADASASVLDQPVSAAEVTLLTALAGLAGSSPRAVRRFVDLYGLARHGTGAGRGPLALMLALARGGTPAERESVAAALRSEAAAPFAPAGASRLRTAIEAAEAYEGGGFSVAAATEAARRAAVFSLG